MKLVDLTNDRYGRLVVIQRAANVISKSRQHAAWVCDCDCGTRVIVRSNSLRRGRTRSCGCLHTDAMSERNHKHGHSERERVTAEYTCWANLKARCYDKTRKQFKDYGGRGITVCDRWRNSYANFIADVGRRPSPKHSIDRIDNDGNYEPSNCRWATRSEQNANQRPRLRVVQ